MRAVRKGRPLQLASTCPGGKAAGAQYAKPLRLSGCGGLALERSQAALRVGDVREGGGDVYVADGALLIDADDGALGDSSLVEDAVLLGDGAVGVEARVVKS